MYATKAEQEFSWFEASPAVSLRLLEAAGLTRDTCVIDVGGGDSHLIDQLVARGLSCLAVLDVSESPLRRAQARLGEAGARVTWIASDVTGDWTLPPVDIWHDRAAFHFLTDDYHRRRYREHLTRTLKVGGHAIIATFALDGPISCSGLPVVRYSPETLAAELGHEFRLVESTPHLHRTPWGTTQSFQYSRFVHTGPT